MHLSLLDGVVVGGYLALTLIVGLWAARRAGRDTTSFFLSGRNMPWWLLGISMVATTFSTDTPNLVTDIVRQNGVAGNWAWWAFLLTGMLTVFVYAKLWRRAGVLTDLEFYELRYSGKPAAFLRGFRAIYLGVVFNVMIMATVTLAAIKIGAVLLGLSPVQVILLSAGVTLVFSVAGGLRSVVVTDLLLFTVAMAGSIAAAAVALKAPGVGGLSGLLANPALEGTLRLLPDPADTNTFVTLLIIPLAVQWWSVWYPGSEPGGGGYVAQRMLSARHERDATAATLLFNIAHYAIRPWPWILVALASLVVFPTLADLEMALPHVASSVIGHDIAYPAMLTLLPAGLLGLVVASLAAAYMSTLSTHLNWGSSYIVNDFWKRFVEPQASEQRLVWVGRVTTVVLMVLAAMVALVLSSALQAFQILLQIGAGTGLLFILRWFWRRINAFSEITAMAVSFLIAVWFQLLQPRFLPDVTMSSSVQLVSGVLITTVAWVIVTFLTRPTDAATLERFESITRVRADRSIRHGILAMLAGTTMVYSLLFATGSWLYGVRARAAFLSVVAILAMLALIALWPKVAGRGDSTTATP
ncbi:MAG: sodium:solute symporter family protein [Gemmatimonadales bacterium]